jgi:hypothetical protein
VPLINVVSCLISVLTFNLLLSSDDDLCFVFSLLSLVHSIPDHLGLALLCQKIEVVAHNLFTFDSDLVCVYRVILLSN